MPKYLDETGLARFSGNIKQQLVRSFDTVADMQAATDLKAGMTCHTNGFHASGDGGAAYYTVSASGTADGFNVIACANSLRAHLVNERYGNNIDFEIGATDKDIYTIFTIPKAMFKMSLELTSGDPTQSTTIREYALTDKPYLCMNIANVGDFIYNSTLYGTDYTQGNHGSIYAMKSNSTDFSVFENGTVLSSLISQGYDRAIASWNCLRLNGENKTIDWSYASYAAPNPRQTLAWDDDAWYIYTSYSRVTHIGSSTAKSRYGKTMQEVLNFCVDRGWPNVATLDGGGSIYIASGSPFRQLSANLNESSFYRDAYICIAFNKIGE